MNVGKSQHTHSIKSRRMLGRTSIAMTSSAFDDHVTGVLWPLTITLMKSSRLRHPLLGLTIVIGSASTAMGQGLDLDPKSPTVREWTCIAATIASDGDPFNKLATRLLQVQASSEDDLARRFVMAMTLRKISKDPEYGGLSATRRSEIQEVIDSIDGASVDRIAGILGAAMVPELSDSTPWYVSRVEMPKFADLIVFLESV